MAPEMTSGWSACSSVRRLTAMQLPFSAAKGWLAGISVRRRVAVGVSGVASSCLRVARKRSTQPLACAAATLASRAWSCARIISSTCAGLAPARLWPVKRPSVAMCSRSNSYPRSRPRQRSCLAECWPLRSSRGSCSNKPDSMPSRTAWEKGTDLSWLWAGGHILLSTKETEAERTPSTMRTVSPEETSVVTVEATGRRSP
mmetsp:Transcript_668/g.1816  ORF Transcript_668/g.1816 Transcript_668/m.1816 type:complete len:201 (-) Transcript_668:3677-4279(-)